jgi:ABC-type dipeptide/oligopeptide/nickel transport system ATPase component
MDGGQIVEQAEPEEFFRAPKHKRTRMFSGAILGR